MIDPPRLTRPDARLIAILHLTVPRKEMRDVMAPGLQELRSVLREQGVSPAGPWFTHHLRADPDVFDFEIGLPVATPVNPSGRVRPDVWPALTVAQTVYHGGYEGLPDAWRQFEAWTAAQGHKPAADLWECYVAGPESSADPADWRTELVRPLRG